MTTGETTTVRESNDSSNDSRFDVKLLPDSDSQFESLQAPAGTLKRLGVRNRVDAIRRVREIGRHSRSPE